MTDLSPRECEILDLVCNGKTDSEIATILDLGIGTIKQHLRLAYLKLDATNRTLAAVRYDRTKRIPAPR